MKPVCNPNPELSTDIFALGPLKILKRLTYACIKPLIDPPLPKEQVRFQHRKSTMDQILLLTQNIEDSFEAKKKAGAIFVNLSAAYDTVWH